MKVYVSGPMTGLPKFNFPAFDAVEELLVAAGCEVFSPAANDRIHWAADGLHDVEEQSYFIDGDVTAYSAAVKLPVEVLYRDDFNYIVNEAEFVVMLPGWEKSTGARYERALAESLGLTVVTAQPVVVNAGPDETWEWELVDDSDPNTVTGFLRTLPDFLDPPIIEPPTETAVLPIAGHVLDDESTGALIRALERRLGHGRAWKEHFPKALSGFAPEALQ